MLEKCKAQTGASFFRVDGRNLSSQVDPEGEAERWVQKNKSSINGPIAPIVVLGLGGGHHIYSLQKTFQKYPIEIFETRQEIIDAFKKDQKYTPKTLQHVNLHNLTNNNILPVVKKIVSKLVYITRHPCSKIYDREKFEKFHMMLVGRDSQSFRNQMEWRKEQGLEIPLVCQTNLLVPKEGAITIKHVHELVVKAKDFKTSSAKVICALRELVL